MRTLAVNGSNDLHLDRTGALAIAQGPDALAQTATQYVRALRGEMVFDTNRGTPLASTVWRGVPNIPQFEAALRRRLLSVAGVTAIVSLVTPREGEVLR